MVTLPAKRPAPSVSVRSSGRTPKEAAEPTALAGTVAGTFTVEPPFSVTSAGEPAPAIVPAGCSWRANR